MDATSLQRDLSFQLAQHLQGTTEQALRDKPVHLPLRITDCNGSETYFSSTDWTKTVISKSIQQSPAINPACGSPPHNSCLLCLMAPFCKPPPPLMAITFLPTDITQASDTTGQSKASTSHSIYLLHLQLPTFLFFFLLTSTCIISYY